MSYSDLRSAKWLKCKLSNAASGFIACHIGSTHRADVILLDILHSWPCSIFNIYSFTDLASNSGDRSLSCQTYYWVTAQPDLTEVEIARFSVS